MSTATEPTQQKKNERRRGIAALVIGIGTSALTIAAVSSGALGAFNATINNDQNSAGAGTLILSEYPSNDPTNVTCKSTNVDANSNSATCAQNLFGGILTKTPTAGSNTTEFTFKNTGSAIANTFTLTPTACVASAQSTDFQTSGDLCKYMGVKITSSDGTKTYFDGTAEALGKSAAIQLATAVGPNTDVPLKFIVTLDPNAPNQVAGQQIRQPVSFTLSA